MERRDFLVGAAALPALTGMAGQAAAPAVSASIEAEFDMFMQLAKLSLPADFRQQMIAGYAGRRAAREWLRNSDGPDADSAMVYRPAVRAPK
jgi:hypothetical protein